jgi:excisionase family DNA binding protein
MTGKLMTARSVADMFDVSPETILRWTRRGTLPAIRLPGGAIRYRPDELESWLADRATSLHRVRESDQRPTALHRAHKEG